MVQKTYNIVDIIYMNMVTLTRVDIFCNWWKGNYPRFYDTSCDFNDAPGIVKDPRVLKDHSMKTETLK